MSRRADELTMPEREEPNDMAERISGWHYSLGWGDGTDNVAPYVPTPMNVVQEMLKLAGAGPGDVLYDLGCGDGRIIMAAVEGVNGDRGGGFEINAGMAAGGPAGEPRLPHHGLGSQP